MRRLFARKRIAELQPDESDASLRRALGATDLILLAIGAVIGAGIFSSIGTAAAGEIRPDGTVIRAAAGPALILSFVLLGAVCGLAALCYAELASMIPQSGSAYSYAYATLGELVAWIIGWDLLLEYAIGNIAVAVAWSGYFSSFLSGFGIVLPEWLTHGYRAVTAQYGSVRSDAAGHCAADCRRADTRQRSGLRHRRRDHRPSAARCAREQPRQQRDGVHQARGAGTVRGRRRLSHRYGQLRAVRAERLARHPSGRGDRVLCLHRIRRHLRRRRRDTRSAAQSADRDTRRAGRVYRHLRRGRHRGDRPRAIYASCDRRTRSHARSMWQGCRPPAGSCRSVRSCRLRRCCWCFSTGSLASCWRWRATGCCRRGRRR